jgi:hypothetical protein
MNSLLKLEFFKSLGFPSKESGLSFINDNKQQAVSYKLWRYDLFATDNGHCPLY